MWAPWDRNRGSSPRRRGPQVSDRGTHLPARLIPAQAGTTTDELRRPQRLQAHPRAGGDHSMGWVVRKTRLGSSPRRRGPQRHPQPGTFRARLIPAQAGTTTSLGLRRRAQRAHPRAGGDHATDGLNSGSSDGSSPRRRGPPQRWPGRKRPPRLIPAQAGTTCWRVFLALTHGAHPRAGGDHMTSRRASLTDAGSSPRRRGPHPVQWDAHAASRLIPAQAGTTLSRSVRLPCASAHPRAGGDHMTSSRASLTDAGSSPRRRGPLRVRGGNQIGRGLIPAQAGTTMGTLW